MINAIASLRIQDKLSPVKNPDFAWCWLFLPALIGYFVLLGAHLNAKPEIGSVKIYNDAYKSLVKSPIEVIATGLVWAEGPLWIEDSTKSSSYLLFSDVVANRIWRYDEGKGFFSVGKSVKVPLSGCKLNKTDCERHFEVGSNGLVTLFAEPDAGADIVACQHGERAVTILYENGTRLFLATHYKEERLHSPNDLVFSNEGHLYFTDPTYGRFHFSKEFMIDVELEHAGVYMIHRDEIRKSIATGLPTSNLKLLIDDMNLPNGIIFSPGYVKAYVSNSDPENAYWRVYDVMDDGTFANGRVFYNATSLIAKGHAGNPDGMAMDAKGMLFASGPGGVLAFTPEGELVARLVVPNKSVSNLAFGPNGLLFMTATDSILRVKLNTRGAKVSGAWR